MAISDKPDMGGAAEPQHTTPYLDLYARVLSGLMLLFGFRQWAVILGIVGGVGGTFEAMTGAWQVATMHFAVVDLVAAVGLWMRASWGNVVWIYAALSEIALHTVFSETFDVDLLVVAFHSITIAGFLLLLFLGRRAAKA
ncbi:MAG TPA: DUF6163 family protein [Bauldia sp.]|nr:DUF6163 family protein [Bauldia sp.]